MRFLPIINVLARCFNQMEAQFVQSVVLLCTFLSIIVKIKLEYFVHRKLADRHLKCSLQHIEDCYIRNVQYLTEFTIFCKQTNVRDF